MFNPQGKMEQRKGLGGLVPGLTGRTQAEEKKMKETPLCTSGLTRNTFLYFLLPRGLGKEVSLHSDFHDVTPESGRD